MDIFLCVIQPRRPAKSINSEGDSKPVLAGLAPLGPRSSSQISGLRGRLLQPRVRVSTSLALLINHRAIKETFTPSHWWIYIPSPSQARTYINTLENTDTRTCASRLNTGSGLGHFFSQRPFLFDASSFREQPVRQGVTLFIFCQAVAFQTPPVAKSHTFTRARTFARLFPTNPPFKPPPPPSVSFALYFLCNTSSLFPYALG